jgi:tripeptidyl-peptidase-1
MRFFLIICAAFAELSLVFDRTPTSVPPGWKSIGPANSGDSLTIELHLYQRNRQELDRLFDAVSNPQSLEYQNFKSQAEINALLAPTDTDVGVVYQWLVAGNVTKSNIINLGDCLKLKATISQLEALFSTKFETFYHGLTNKHVNAHIGQAFLPADVKRVVELVYGLSAFPVGLKGRLGHRSKIDPNLGYKIVAQSWQSLYGVPANWQPQSPLTSQGVIQFDGETYAPEGMEGYSKNIISIVGPTQNTTVGPEHDAAALEAQLDVEAQAACGRGVPQWFWLMDPSKWMLSFTTEFFAHADPLPLSISISYAWSELDQCGQATTPYDCNTFGVNSQGLVDRTNTNFQKIGLRGVSVMVASGDSGVYGRTDGSCSGRKFFPDFPACSPFVTSVGGTYDMNPKYLPTGGSTPQMCAGQCVSGGTEVAVSFPVCSYTSGGGFSNFSPMPSWQTNAVKQYLTSGVVLPPSYFYNATNRGFPDVSAQGYNIAIYNDHTAVDLVSGTSAASPAFSGIVTMLNDASLVKTGKPLGFLNPLLYQMQSTVEGAFNDITQGDNRCTEEGCSVACKGFNAFKGWDPVTGLGTPNYSKMAVALDQILTNKLSKK